MFESTRLTDAHTLEGFACGRESLNTWLSANARRTDCAVVAHVYVWTPLGDQKVSAYFAICPTEVVRNPSLRGQGSGEQLLLDALGKAVAASETSTATSSPSATASVV